jgi:hypothetical protein
MACDYLSVLSTSCECERAFNKARRTITYDRNQLSGATIESIQLQQNWLQRGVVKSLLRDLESLVRKAKKYKTPLVAPSLPTDKDDLSSQLDDLYCQ